MRVTQSELSAQDKCFIRKTRFHDVVGSCLFIFVISLFVGFGISGPLAVKHPSDFTRLLLALSSGVLIMFSPIVLQMGRETFLEHREVKAGIAEVIKLRPIRAIEVFVSNTNNECLLLVEGREHLLCKFNWWDHPCRIPCTGQGWKCFPSAELTIRRLPRSGKVLSVETNGAKLHVERIPDPYHQELGNKIPYLKVENTERVQLQIVTGELEDILEFV